jgi:hypothetical protein
MANKRQRGFEQTLKELGHRGSVIVTSKGAMKVVIDGRATIVNANKKRALENVGQAVLRRLNAALRRDSKAAAKSNDICGLPKIQKTPRRTRADIKAAIEAYGRRGAPNRGNFAKLDRHAQKFQC